MLRFYFIFIEMQLRADVDRLCNPCWSPHKVIYNYWLVKITINDVKKL